MYRNIFLKKMLNIMVNLLCEKNSGFKVTTAELTNIFGNFVHPK